MEYLNWLLYLIGSLPGLIALVTIKWDRKRAKIATKGEDFDSLRKWVAMLQEDLEGFITRCETCEYKDYYLKKKQKLDEKIDRNI